MIILSDIVFQTRFPVSHARVYPNSKTSNSPIPFLYICLLCSGRLRRFWRYSSRYLLTSIQSSNELSLCYLIFFQVTHDLVGAPCQIPYLQLSVANAFHLTSDIVVYVKVGTLMACGYYVYLFTQVVYILPSYGLSLCYLTLFPVTHDLVGAPYQIPYLQLSVANAFQVLRCRRAPTRDVQGSEGARRRENTPREHPTGPGEGHQPRDLQEVEEDVPVRSLPVGTEYLQEVEENRQVWGAQCRVCTNKVSKCSLWGSDSSRSDRDRSACNARTKFFKVGITEDKSVRTPIIPTTTVASQKLTYTTETTTSKLTIKLRDCVGKLIAADVFPVKGNIVVNAERLVSVLKEMAVCKACQLGTLQLFKKSAKNSIHETRARSCILWRCISGQIRQKWWRIQPLLLCVCYFYRHGQSSCLRSWL